MVTLVAAITGILVAEYPELVITMQAKVPDTESYCAYQSMPRIQWYATTMYSALAYVSIGYMIAAFVLTGIGLNKMLNAGERI